jgi:hypothetical protein
MVIPGLLADDLQRLVAARAGAARAAGAAGAAAATRERAGTTGAAARGLRAGERLGRRLEPVVLVDVRAQFLHARLDLTSLLLQEVSHPANSSLCQ